MNNEIKKAYKETYEAYKSRAILYRLFYEELVNEFGEERATKIMAKAIYRWGGLKSHRYEGMAKNKDFKGVADEFIKSSVCGGELFKPSIHSVDNRSAVIDMERCPLVEAWQDMGLSSSEVNKMCEIANATDYGKYEGMGFKLTIEYRLAAGDDRCRLNVVERD